MTTDNDVRVLESAWGRARSTGALGSATVPELLDHAAGYVPAASVVLGSRVGDRPISVVDIGAGVGVPGIPLALLQPAWTIHLVDADEQRCDLAEGAVAALGLAERVTVTHGRADDLGREEHWRGSADLVVTRSFGSASEVAECGLPLVRDGGALVVSTTEHTASLWRELELATISSVIAGGHESPSGRFLTIRRRGALDARFPRRPPARQRSPLFPSS